MFVKLVSTCKNRESKKEGSHFFFFFLSQFRWAEAKKALRSMIMARPSWNCPKTQRIRNYKISVREVSNNPVIERVRLKAII